MTGSGRLGARGAVAVAGVITRGEEKEVRGETGMADSRRLRGSACCVIKLLVGSSTS